MTLNLRRMRKYHPRRSSKEIKLNKQKLIDLEHQIKADVGEFLVLVKEGSNDEALKSYQKAKGDLLKYKPDMEKVAEAIGGRVPKYVTEFLNTIDKLLQFPQSSNESFTLWVDEAKVKSCYTATRKLEDSLLK
jgi:hypothetical protein